jgi:probable phosphoglycerate mutase
MELILVRHGLPKRVEREEGAADPALSDAGWDHARAVGQWLAANEEIDAIYASPMRRAHQTAMPFAELADQTITLVDEVAEFDRNSRNYVPVEQLKKENYAAWLRMANGDYGKQADLSKFRDTVVRGLESIIDQNRGKRVAVFCHGGVVNVWSTHCLGLEPQLFADVRYCSISRYLCASTGQRNMHSLNETQHLTD